MRGLVTRVVGALAERPWVSLLIVFAASAGALWYAKFIEIRSDMEDLFPDHTPVVQRAKEAREIVGSRSELQLLIGSDDPAVNREAAEAIAAKLRGDPLVGSVEVKRETAFFEKNALLYLSREDVAKVRQEVADAIAAAVRKRESDDFEFDLEEEDDEPAAGDAAKKKDEPRFPSEEELRERYGAKDLREYYETPDGKVVAVKVYPSFKPAETGKTGQLNERVDAVVAEVFGRYPDTKLTRATEGDYAHVTAAVNQIKSEGMLALAIALGGIALILISYFRRIRSVLLTLVPLVIGLIWTFFLARAAIGYLNLITAFIFSILVGLGIDFVVHAAARTDEEYREGVPIREALPAALANLGRPFLAAALTTAATFFSLVIFEFRGFSQFGLIAGFGVLVCLACVYFVYPPLESAAAGIWKPKRRAPAPEPAAGGLTAGRRRLAWGVVAAGLLLVIGAAVSLPRLTFEADMRKLRAKSTKKTSELRQKYSKEGEKRGSSPALFITGGLQETRALHRALEGRIESEPLLEGVRSIYSFVPEEQEAKMVDIREAKRLIDNKYAILEGQDKADADKLLKYLEPEPFGPEDLPDWLKERFTDTGGQLGRYVLIDVGGVKSDGHHVVEIQKRLGEVHVDGKTYYSTASWFMLGEAYSVVKKEGPIAVGVACLVVLLFLIMDLRRVRDVVAVFVPLLAGFVIFLGILAVAEIPLNIFNIVVLPTIFGIGVDTAIHIVHRLNEGQGVRVVLRTTGAAAGVSAATTAVGFFALTFVSNQGLQSIGWVAVVGILTSYVVGVALIAAMAALGWKSEWRRAV